MDTLTNWIPWWLGYKMMLQQRDDMTFSWLKKKRCTHCEKKMPISQIPFWILLKCKWSSHTVYFPYLLNHRLAHSLVACPSFTLYTAYLIPRILLNQSGIWEPHFQSITTQIRAEAFDIESFVKSVQMAGGWYHHAKGHIHVEISAVGGLSWCSQTN